MGSHSGDVADVVADVVRDGCRISRIVFRNSRFDFPDEVGSDVRRLRVDSTADTGEERLGGSSHSEGQHGGRDFGQLVADVKIRSNEFESEKVEPVCHVFRCVDQFVEDQIPGCDVEKSESDHHESHDRSGTERNLESAVETFTGSLSGSAGSSRRCFHAEESAKPGEESARQERNRYKRILNTANRKNQKDYEEDDENKPHPGILLFQIRHGAFADISRDLFHACVSFRSFDHQVIADECRRECDQRADRGDPPCRGDAAGEWMEFLQSGGNVCNFWLLCRCRQGQHAQSCCWQNTDLHDGFLSFVLYENELQ